MGKYLKLFETHNQYESYTADTSSFITPNVSYCKDQANVVHYNPYYDPYNGYDYVDLGLPSGTKWATMNVGASSITDYGYYYQYGKGNAQYAATSGQSNYTGTENPLDKSLDTAAIVMGGDWHMPTQTQFNELIANTTNQWAVINNIYGYKFTATNGNYVFFPAAGVYANGSKTDVAVYGCYWSSTPTNSNYAILLRFSRSVGKEVRADNRSCGISVRGVVG